MQMLHNLNLADLHAQTQFVEAYNNHAGKLNQCVRGGGRKLPRTSSKFGPFLIQAMSNACHSFTRGTYVGLILARHLAPTLFVLEMERNCCNCERQ